MNGYQCEVSIQEPDLEEAVRHFMSIRLAETLGEFDDIVRGIEFEILVDRVPVRVRVVELIGAGAVLNREIHTSSIDEDALENHSYIAVRQPHRWRVGQFAIVHGEDYGEDQASMLELAKFVYSDE